MALILTCARKVCYYNPRVHTGDLEVASGNPFRGLCGQTLGIIGFGKIGRALAPKAIAFEMRVRVHDPHIDGLRARALQFVRTELDVILAEADFASFHLPLVESTRGLIAETRLRHMKSTPFIVNTSPDAIMDQGSTRRR